jgi:hypothetical protein
MAATSALAFALDVPGRGALPDGGLDRVTIWAFNDLPAGRVPDLASAVEVLVGWAHRGSGRSQRMLTALRDAARVQDDGLPADPWQRVHARAGGRIRQVAPASMVMAGSLAQ